MDIRKKEFYYTSIGLTSDRLPTSAKFVKRLKPVSDHPDRDCAIIELESYSSKGNFPYRYMLIVQRDLSYGLFDKNEKDLVTLYVFKGEEYLNKEEVDFAGKRDFVDQGLITFCKDEAYRYTA